MTTISMNADVATLINVFTVDPERQDELFQILHEATEQVIRFQPGFISANFHKSLDGRHVANYAQWRSVADLEAMLVSPESQEHLRRASEIASEVRPVVYRVASVEDRPATP
jgi:antibiotic biosynthesis monooxygenase (ABM) superfamily enzyme